MSDSNFPAVSLGVTQTLMLWTTLTPELSEVRAANPGSDPAFAAEVRHAEIVAGSIALLIGVIGSVSMKSADPFIASATTVLGLAIAYEITLNAPPSGKVRHV